MSDTHLRMPDALAEAARRKAGLPAGTATAALARYALARLAGWDRETALSVARISVTALEGRVPPR